MSSGSYIFGRIPVGPSHQWWLISMRSTQIRS